MKNIDITFNRSPLQATGGISALFLSVWCVDHV